MRLIDADELAHALDDDVELCAKALDDMTIVGKVREDMQFEKDCKQNCIWYISEQPTVEAIPIEFIKRIIEIFDCERGNTIKDTYAHILTALIEFWEYEQEKENEIDKCR